jgi:hypothetical protein
LGGVVGALVSAARALENRVAVKRLKAMAANVVADVCFIRLAP